MASNTFTLFEDYKEATIENWESKRENGKNSGQRGESKPDHEALSALLQMVSLPKYIPLLMGHKDYIFPSVIWIRCGHMTHTQ